MSFTLALRRCNLETLYFGETGLIVLLQADKTGYSSWNFCWWWWLLLTMAMRMVMLAVAMSMLLLWGWHWQCWWQWRLWTDSCTLRDGVRADKTGFFKELAPLSAYQQQHMTRQPPKHNIIIVSSALPPSEWAPLLKLGQQWLIVFQIWSRSAQTTQVGEWVSALQWVIAIASTELVSLLTFLVQFPHQRWPTHTSLKICTVCVGLVDLVD